MSGKKLEHYPKTEHFEVVDTIGVPHPFMIGSRHVVWASDRFSGILSAESIKALEKDRRGPSCCHPGCQLSYEKHEQALLVKCRVKDNDKLKAYLESIVKQCEADGYAGFAFLDGTKEAG